MTGGRRELADVKILDGERHFSHRLLGEVS